MPVSAARRTASLARALGLGRRGVHAFAGAGGKTNAICRLLGERPRTLATTTAHLAGAGFGRGVLAVASDTAGLARVQGLLLGSRPLTLALAGDGARLRSPDLAWHVALAVDHPDALILVEADGARQRLVKLPGPHEPAWPPGPLAQAIVVVGLAGLGRPLGDVAHHPERFVGRGRRVPALGLAHVEHMLREYIERAPPRVPLAVLFTGAGGVARPTLLRLVRVCERMVRRRDPSFQDPNVPLHVVATDDVAVGPYEFWDLGRDAQPGVPRLPGVCGVLLAAGLGRRYGRAVPGAAKLLVRWRGRTVVEHAVRRWCTAGPAQLVVVTGEAPAGIDSLVQRTSRGARVHVVHNPRPARGLGSSVRVAARAARPGLALFFGHADMPAIRLETLLRIADVGSTLRRFVVVPTVRGAPRNPVFFPADLRGELARVPDASGGRAVYAAHSDRVLNLELGAGADLVDLDRPEDLQRLESSPRRRRRAGGAGI